MSIFVFISDGWGAKFGGINSFNYDLCLATAKIMRNKHKVISITMGATPDQVLMASKEFQIISLEKSFFENDEYIANCVRKNYPNEEIWWIGHDIKTGFKAIECANITKGKSAVIHHMDYKSYHIYKSKNGEETNKKIQEQKQVLFKADKVFAVGPKLKKSAITKISGISNQKKEVTELIPGLADISHNENYGGFSAVTLGRISRETNIIKQARLAIAAFSKACGENIGIFGNDVSMSVIGLEDEETSEELIQYAKLYAKRLIPIIGIHYTDNRSTLFDSLKESSICMMLSLHEGFGLVGFEAIAAGVPLILTKNSGLYEFLNDLDAGIATSLFTAIDIKGSDDDEGFDIDDLKEVSDSVVKIKMEYDRYKQKAIMLKEMLLKKNYTWENTAKTLSATLDKKLLTMGSTIHKKKEINRWLYLEELKIEHKRDIDRKNINIKFTKCLENFNVISIEGINGSGKQHFIHNYFNKKRGSKNYEKSVIMYNAQEDETIDDLFISLQSEIKVSENQGILRYNEFLDGLQGKILILNRFDHVNIESYKKFIDHSINYYKKNANIILVSETMFDDLDNSTELGKVEVGGFNINELKEYIENNNIKLSDENNVEKLLVKTGGNPFAVSTFFNMINNMGYSDNDLLRENLSNESTKIRAWMNEIKSKLNRNELILLQALSLIDTSFDKTFINFIIKRLNDFYMGSDKIVNFTFEKLTKKYLVNKITKSSWNICEIISDFFKHSIEDENLKKCVHQIIGDYYCYEFRKYEEENKKLELALQACRHYQLSKCFKKSAMLIYIIRKTTQKNGDYEAFIRICKKQFDNDEECNDWIVYNLAHCYMIIGMAENGKRVIEKRYKNIEELENNNEGLCLTRVYSEIISELGEKQRALSILDKKLTLIINEKIDVKKHIVNQSVATRSMLYIKNNKYDLALKDCKLLLEDNGKDIGVGNEELKYAKANGLVRMAIIFSRKNEKQDTILKALNEAREIFKICKDKRGEGWVLSITGDVLLKNNEYNELKYQFIDEAIHIRSSIGECSLEYYAILNEYKKHTLPKEIVDKINDEIERLKKIKYIKNVVSQ